ncbi:SDR family NAD(P)-dependent oxidoreductase [Ramlibacter alkalitolerans]|uniref:SDR family NAD(P)-dependent oxidoreductase n=1 Tax=Ramlibacter alkalitolerans TaxID=2039631 RepID=A0ABS1JS74_9BURK|nr:SDR family NAD(P)-dependent oxidoreductase [Ramlibacter alkalitolerans]MBL0427102.1 SDR family NAD(P)-dependent oxidoreductase [Ramlibacter alkalitolerans]
MEWQERTVMITGAAGHLGQALAADLRARGARLALLGHDVASLRRAYVEAPDLLLLAADLRDAAQVGAATSEAIARFGRIHALCHIAGGFRMGDAVHETAPATWDFLMDVNARSLVNVARAVVPHLIEHGGGRIVTVGATAALQGAARMGAYSASKSALMRLSESMAAELKAHGINVNCVLPSIIDTPENRAAMPDGDPTRWVAPQALADVIAFLCSDAARAIHGATIPVRGLA